MQLINNPLSRLAKSSGSKLNWFFCSIASCYSGVIGVIIMAAAIPRKNRPGRMMYSGLILTKVPSEPIMNIEPESIWNPIAITSLFGNYYVINGVIKQETMYNRAGMQNDIPTKSG